MSVNRKYYRQQDVLQVQDVTRKTLAPVPQVHAFGACLALFNFRFPLVRKGILAELSAHVSGALGAEGGATSMAPPVAGSRELLETVLAEAPQMLPFEDRAWEAER